MFLVGLFLTQEDYSVYTLNVPPLAELSTSEGYLFVKSAKIRGKSPNYIFLSTRPDFALRDVRLSCSISTFDKQDCISHSDKRFYTKKKLIGRFLDGYRFKL